MKKIVFVAPNPDDVELFAGGAAIKHSADGFKTVEILLTKGELGAFLRKKNLADRRWGEAREGASILGINKLKFLGFKDKKVGLNEGTSRKIKKAIEAENPELIYAPDPEFTFYGHPDHSAAGKIIQRSFDEIPIRFYHTTKPNLEIDIRDVHERKTRAIKSHRSQRFIIWWWRFFKPRLHNQKRKKVERFRQT